MNQAQVADALAQQAFLFIAGEQAGRRIEAEHRRGDARQEFSRVGVAQQSVKAAKHFSIGVRDLVDVPLPQTFIGAGREKIRCAVNLFGPAPRAEGAQGFFDAAALRKVELDNARALFPRFA